MSDNAVQSPLKPAGGKLVFFRVLALLCVSAAGIIAAESVLRWRQARISNSDALEPGMVQYEADLGWKLEPGWTGHHQHHDFAAKYSINKLGFRADTPFPEQNKQDKLTVFVGDSFTFGLGVNDAETFVHLLNASAPTGVAFANGAIPGYSTDQEALLIEKRILDLRPDRIVLVVYVGNDLFDNLLAVPLQVSSPKPFFEKTERGLVLRNSPVPLGRTPRTPGQVGLLTTLLGPDRSKWPLKTRLEQRSELLRVISQAVWPEKNHRDEFAERFAPALGLFDLMLERVVQNCARQKIKLTLALVAGRSFFTNQGSLSAQYQDYLREQVAASGKRKNLPVIDVASRMSARHHREKGPWFYPNDGHLNPTGHRMVAEILADELRRE